MEGSRPKQIIYIEDEQDMIDLVSLILNRKGFKVQGVSSGQAGLSLIRKRLPDLVLLDLMMPDMDGWEVYREIKINQDTSHIPVMVITAKAQSVDKVLGLQMAKVDDYISKPFTPNELVERIQVVLEGTIKDENQTS